MKKIILGILSLGLVSSIAFAGGAEVYAKYNCKMCHGPDGKKMAPGAKHLITGLSKEKVLADLKGYKAGTTNNGGNAKIMYAQAKKLSDADIEALAEYIATLK